MELASTGRKAESRQWGAKWQSCALFQSFGFTGISSNGGYPAIIQNQTVLDRVW